MAHYYHIYFHRKNIVTVSISVSPFFTDDCAAEKITSADNLLCQFEGKFCPGAIFKKYISNGNVS
jgi:hypothetical protein